VPRKYFLFAVWQIVGSEEQMPGRGRDCEIQGIKLPGLDEPRSQTHPETDRLIPQQGNAILPPFM
jgi:hypothetical protein